MPLSPRGAHATAFRITCLNTSSLRTLHWLSHSRQNRTRHLELPVPRIDLAKVPIEVEEQQHPRGSVAIRLDRQPDFSVNLALLQRKGRSLLNVHQQPSANLEGMEEMALHLRNG